MKGSLIEVCARFRYLLAIVEVLDHGSGQKVAMELIPAHDLVVHAFRSNGGNCMFGSPISCVEATVPYGGIETAPVREPGNHLHVVHNQLPVFDHRGLVG